MCAAQEGQAVTISITTAQLTLIERACTHYHLDLYGCKVMPPEKEADLRAIADMCADTVANPGPRGMVHGFAL